MQQYGGTVRRARAGQLDRLEPRIRCAVRKRIVSNNFILKTLHGGLFTANQIMYE